MHDYKQIIYYVLCVLGQHATTCLTNSGQQWAWQGKKELYLSTKLKLQFKLYTD